MSERREGRKMSGYEEIPLENPCTMCEAEEATTRWGAPVCRPCAIWLTKLDGELQAMEDIDPDLRAVGDHLRRISRGE